MMRFGRLVRAVFVAALLFTACACAQATGSPSAPPKLPPAIPPKPAAAPERWRPLIGDYRSDNIVLYVLEQGGALVAAEPGGRRYALKPLPGGSFRFPPGGALSNAHAVFGPIAGGVARELSAGQRRLQRADAGGAAFQIKPMRSVGELVAEALRAQPPVESGDFRPAGLVELAPLDSSIHLDIRYATANNFLGTPVYAQARAFLQRPAAEALLRAVRRLAPLGYGVLIHDAYRPWYVTKVFWEATPPDKRIFVADPKDGSRHNRGCAIDLTLYDLKTGAPVEMPGGYDEMSERSYPEYPGGTSLARWHRDLLRRVMEAEGFTVYEAEWWHFDYRDWKSYRIGNIPFDQIGSAAGK
jgi:D-alanyl-D-alanine dipeptidase